MFNRCADSVGLQEASYIQAYPLPLITWSVEQHHHDRLTMGKNTLGLFTGKLLTTTSKVLSGY